MKHKKLIIIISIIAALLVIAAAVFFIYVGTYYEADMEAIAIFNYSGFETREMDDGTLAFVPKVKHDTGIIFYPGGKVEYRAYIPLMQSLASQGILCLLVDMPFNLAVFDIDRADGLQEQFLGVDRWFMAGHSLGGSMACEYLSETENTFKGVILLGSYSAADLSQTSMRALSIWGTEDKILDREAYEENKKNLPPRLTEFVIQGGNHAYYGVYGEQDGDGTATITNRKQIEITANKIAMFVK